MDHLRAMVHRIKLTAAMMWACADFAHSRASRTQIGDWPDNMNSATFYSLTVA